MCVGQFSGKRTGCGWLLRIGAAKRSHAGNEQQRGPRRRLHPNSRYHFVTSFGSGQAATPEAACIKTSPVHLYPHFSQRSSGGILPRAGNPALDKVDFPCSEFACDCT
jgi:hypothetical protein